TEALDRLRELPQLASSELDDRDDLPRRLCLVRQVVQCSEEAHVAPAVERSDDGRASLRTVAGQRLGQRSCCVALEIRQRVDLRAEVLEHDVRVPRRAERRAEPRELRPQRLDSLAAERATADAQDRPEAACRNKKVVQLLGVLSESQRRVVRQQLADLAGDRSPQVLDAGVGATRRPPALEAEDAEELRLPGAGARAGLQQRVADRLQLALVAVDELDL